MAKMFHLVVFQQHFVNNFKISSECNWYRWIKKKIVFPRWEQNIPPLGMKRSQGREKIPQFITS
jgi:hypothetical protein